MRFNLKLKIKSSNLESLLMYKLLLKKIFFKLNLEYSNVDLPKKKRRLTLNKSPHVNKTAREQFELIKYSTIFYVKAKMNSIPLKYIFLNKPNTVLLKVEKTY